MLIDQLQNGRYARKRALDVIIDSYPIDSSREDIVVDDLLEVDNCFVASNKYARLISNNKEISINELSQYPLLLQQAKTSTRKALDNIMGDSLKMFEPNIEVATTEVMLDLVKRGWVLAILPKCLLWTNYNQMNL